MKKLILSLSVLFFSVGVFSQSETEKTPAQKTTDELVQMYSLDAEQAVEMLKIQERKYRNLAEIEPIKKTDPQLYIQKVRSLQYGNDSSFRMLLNEKQELVFNQKQAALREKKAVAYKDMKTAGAQQQEIDKKMTELDGVVAINRNASQIKKRQGLFSAAFLFAALLLAWKFFTFTSLKTLLQACR